MGALFACFNPFTIWIKKFVCLLLLRGTFCHLHNANCQDYQLHLNDASIKSFCLIFVLPLNANYNKNTLIFSMTLATKIMQMGRMRPAGCLLSTPALHTQHLRESQEPFNIWSYSKADGQEWSQECICTKENTSLIVKHKEMKVTIRCSPHSAAVWT